MQDNPYFFSEGRMYLGDLPSDDTCTLMVFDDMVLVRNTDQPGAELHIPLDMFLAVARDQMEDEDDEA